MRRTFVLPSVLLLLVTPAFAEDLLVETAGVISIELLTAESAFSNVMSIRSITGPDGQTYNWGLGKNPRPDGLGGLEYRSPVCAEGVEDEVEGILPGILVIKDRPLRRGCRVFLDSNKSTNEIDSFPKNVTLSFAMCSQIDGDTSCDFVWSSDPTDNVSANPPFSNDNGFDHLRTTTPSHLSARRYGKRVYQLAWEDFLSSGDRDFNDLIAVLRVGGDADGDALWDDWEVEGIDADADGQVDLKLKGAKTSHKDIYLEIDAMDFHAVAGNAALSMHAAFYGAPVSNLDGLGGINLHTEISDTKIPHRDNIYWNDIPACCANASCDATIKCSDFLQPTCCADDSCDPQDDIDCTTFDDIKCDFFGNEADRTSGKLCDAFPPAKLMAKYFAYRYSLWAHGYNNNTSSGVGEIVGNDHLVSLGGSWTGETKFKDGTEHNTGDSMERNGTLMHEFGHTLGLLHGGRQNHNYKPNFISVMNYSHQLTLIENITETVKGRLDYSRQELLTLNEDFLDESDGVTGFSFGERKELKKPGDKACWCGTDNRLNCADASKELNWNESNGSNETVSLPNMSDYDLTACATKTRCAAGPEWVRECSSNSDCTQGTGPCIVRTNTLLPFNDWKNLIFDFHVSSDYEGGTVRQPLPFDEVEAPQATALKQCRDDQVCVPVDRATWAAACNNPGSIPATDSCVGSLDVFGNSGVGVDSVTEACEIVQRPDIDACADAERELMTLMLSLCTESLYGCCSYSKPPEVQRSVREVFLHADEQLSIPEGCPEVLALVEAVNDGTGLMMPAAPGADATYRGTRARRDALGTRPTRTGRQTSSGKSKR